MLEDEAKKEADRQSKADDTSNDQSDQDDAQVQASDDADGDDDQTEGDSGAGDANASHEAGNAADLLDGDGNDVSDSPDADHSADADGNDASRAIAQVKTDADSDVARPTQNVILDAMGSADDELIPDVFEALKRDLFEAAAEGLDDAYRTVPAAPSCPGNEAQGLAMLEQVRTTTTKLRAQLLSLVQASRRNHDRAKRHGRKMDSKRLIRIVSGDTRLFRQRDERIQPDTAVHVLTDLSGSMIARNAATVAQQASLAIALALEGIPGVNPAVTFFCGRSDDPVRSALRHGELIRQNVSRFVLAANGTTPMAEAIWYAAFELTKTRERRKQIIVITDGEPDNAAACHAVLDLCRNSGIEVMGIGVNHKVDQFFNRHIMIDSIDELRATLFKLMREQLTVDAA
jgi:cobalamin biosynthesis protein CobT